MAGGAVGVEVDAVVGVEVVAVEEEDQGVVDKQTQNKDCI